MATNKSREAVYKHNLEEVNKALDAMKEDEKELRVKMGSKEYDHKLATYQHQKKRLEGSFVLRKAVKPQPVIDKLPPLEPFIIVSSASHF